MKKLFAVGVSLLFSSAVFATGNPALFNGLFLNAPDKPTTMLVVELARGTMSLLEAKNGEIDIIEQVPVSIGKNGYGKMLEGDKRTPIGIYEINSYIPDGDLPERYGPGAFTLDYPNIIDRQHSRTGSGIWIHGIDRNLNARPFQDSDGCVVVDNKQFSRLKPQLDKRPMVILADEIPALDESLSTEIKQQIADWEAAWESLNVDDYLSFYSQDFNNGESDYRAWSAHKKRVGKFKTRIDVDVSNLTILRYPGEANTLRVEFGQRYRSNNFNGFDEKRQYWQKQDNGQWQIVYEASR